MAVIEWGVWPYAVSCVVPWTYVDLRRAQCW